MDRRLVRRWCHIWFGCCHRVLLGFHHKLAWLVPFLVRSCHTHKHTQRETHRERKRERATQQLTTHNPMADDTHKPTNEHVKVPHKTKNSIVKNVVFVLFGGVDPQRLPQTRRYNRWMFHTLKMLSVWLESHRYCRPVDSTSRRRMNSEV